MVPTETHSGEATWQMSPVLTPLRLKGASGTAAGGCFY